MVGSGVKEMVVFILALAFGLAASQCMKWTPCTKDHGLIPSRLSLSHCVDQCLANTRSFCYSVQWTPSSSSQCIYRVQTAAHTHRVASPGHQPSGDASCVGLSKTVCSEVPDFLCMKRYGQSSKEYGEMTGYINRFIGSNVQQEECLALCRLDPDCRGVLWNRKRKSCRLFYQKPGRSSMHESPDKAGKQGGVFYKKTYDCAEVQRPAVLLASSKRPSKPPQKQSRTLEKCLKKLLGKAVSALQWSRNQDCLGYYIGQQTVQKNGPPAKGDVDVTVTKRNCSQSGCPKHKATCLSMESTVDAGMSGGLVLSLANRNGCESLCTSCSNCRAVDWRQTVKHGRGECTFHHLFKPLERMPNTTHLSMTTTCKNWDKAYKALEESATTEDDDTSEDCQLCYHGINRCRLKCLVRKGCHTYLYSPTSLHCCFVFRGSPQPWSEDMMRFNLSQSTLSEATSPSSICPVTVCTSRGVCIRSRLGRHVCVKDKV